jgi:PST family polysaccharide transporter
VPQEPARTPSDNDAFFDTRHLEADLRRRSVRGGAVTTTAQASRFVLQLAAISLLARLLSPEDFGLIAMVTAITGFALMFRDLGLSAATVQKAEINHAQVSGLFWINVGAASLLTLAVVAAGPAIAAFYGDPRLTRVAFALSLVLFLGGLPIQHTALLKRQMSFGRLGLVDIGSQIVSIATGILLALNGAGYWALVGMQLAAGFSHALGTWIVCPWRPGLPVRGAGTRRLLNFGLDIAGFGIVNYFSRNVDKLLLGRFCGSSALGLYSQAYRLMLLPINQLRGPLVSVALPALSRMQGDAPRFRSFYSQFVRVFAFINMPVVTLVFVCSDEIIALLLGSQWGGASIIFKILALTAFIQPVESTRGSVFMSLGNTRRYLIWGAISAVFFVLSFVLGLPWGPIGVASGYTIANYVLLFPALWYCFRGTPVSITDFVRAIARPVTASVFMGGVVELLRLALLELPDVVIFLSCAVAGAASYVVVWCILPGGLASLREITSHATLLLSRKTDASA